MCLGSYHLLLVKYMRCIYMLYVAVFKVLTLPTISRWGDNIYKHK